MVFVILENYYDKLIYIKTAQGVLGKLIKERLIRRREVGTNRTALMWGELNSDFVCFSP